MFNKHLLKFIIKRAVRSISFITEANKNRLNRFIHLSMKIIGILIGRVKNTLSN